MTLKFAAAAFVAVSIALPVQAGSMKDQINICIESSLKHRPQANVQDRSAFVLSCVADPEATSGIGRLISRVAECRANGVSDPSKVIQCARAQTRVSLSSK
jgi:hypothetical protein